MTADEAAALVAVLKAGGVQHFKAGDVELTFHDPQRVRMPKPKAFELPTGATLCDPVES